MRAEVDDTEMTAAEFRAARSRGTPAQVVTSRSEFDAHSRHGGARFEVYETKAAARKGAESAQLAADGATIVDVAS